MIYVDLRSIRDANYDLPCMESRADAACRRLRRLKRELPDNILKKYRIGERLGCLCREAEALSEQLGKVYEVTNWCVDQYAEAEYENEKNAKEFV